MEISYLANPIPTGLNTWTSSGPYPGESALGAKKVNLNIYYSIKYALYSFLELYMLLLFKRLQKI